MNIENLYKVKSHFVTREVGDEIVVVPLVNNVAQMDRLYTLNETAGFLWENLNEGATEKNLIELLSANFQVEESIAATDVRRFLQDVEKLVGR